MLTRLRLRLRRFPLAPPRGRNDYERIRLGKFGHFTIVPTAGGEFMARWSGSGRGGYYSSLEEARASVFRVATELLAEAVADLRRQRDAS